MKASLHRAADRELFDHGVIVTRQTFSRRYPEGRRQFGELIVLNDDALPPGGGYADHRHEEMEIVSLPLAGAVDHRDSLGNRRRLVPGDLQILSAGSGVEHCDRNALDSAPSALLQIWIQPWRQGLAPSYQAASGCVGRRRNEIEILVSPDLRGTLRIHQRACLSHAGLDAGRNLLYPLAEGQGLYVFVLAGAAVAAGVALGPRDGLALRGEAGDLGGASLGGPAGPGAALAAGAGGADLLLIEVPVGTQGQGPVGMHGQAGSQEQGGKPGQIRPRGPGGPLGQVETQERG